jgi:hypothetical protein
MLLKLAVQQNYSNVPSSMFGLTASQMDMFIDEDSALKKIKTDPVSPFYLPSILFWFSAKSEDTRNPVIFPQFVRASCSNSFSKVQPSAVGLITTHFAAFLRMP